MLYKVIDRTFRRDLNKGGRTLGVVRLPGTVDEKGRSAYPSSYRVWFCHTQIFSAETGSSTATAYLTNEVLARPNLTVACSITVERILFDREPSLRAAGVQLTTAPAAPKFRVRAKREIILSGGVIGSAQTLLLSGIGPKDELEQVGVNCVQDLPSVGKHLADVCIPDLIRSFICPDPESNLAHFWRAIHLQSQTRVHP